MLVLLLEPHVHGIKFQLCYDNLIKSASLYRKNLVVEANIVELKVSASDVVMLVQNSDVSLQIH